MPLSYTRQAFLRVVWQIVFNSARWGIRIAIKIFIELAVSLRGSMSAVDWTTFLPTKTQSNSSTRIICYVKWFYKQSKHRVMNNDGAHTISRIIITVYLDTFHDSQRSFGFHRHPCHIKIRALKSRILSALWRHGCSAFNVTFYCQARWLLRGKCLQCIYELRDEIAIFL